VSRLLQAGLVLAGLLAARVLGIERLEQSGFYLWTVAALVAAGLYASTFSIDLNDVRASLSLIVRAITVGVVLKAVLIGVAIVLFSRQERLLPLGVVMAQIDPLSVAAMNDNPRMSERAKSILAAWASFDDPVTVLLTFYVTGLTLLSPITALNSTKSSEGEVLSYLFDLSLNLALAAVVFGISRRLRSRLARALVLSVTSVVAVSQYLMLALAVLHYGANWFLDRRIGFLLR
jgi:hypothetical protein